MLVVIRVVINSREQNRSLEILTLHDEFNLKYESRQEKQLIGTLPNCVYIAEYYNLLIQITLFLRHTTAAYYTILLQITLYCCKLHFTADTTLYCCILHFTASHYTLLS